MAVGLIKTADGYSVLRVKATAYEVLEKSEPNLLIIAQDYVTRFVRKLMGL